MSYHKEIAPPRLSLAGKFRYLHPLLGSLALLGMAGGMAGCGLPRSAAMQPLESPPPLAISATIQPHLHAALAHAPANSENFAFTDWSVLKEVGGVPALTGADSLDERIAFLRTLTVDEQAVATAFGRNFYPTHAEEWGWDSTDLLWEASFTLAGTPVYLLRFRADFDFAPVLDHLDRRGYTRTHHAETLLFRHEMDLGAEWLGKTELAILNIAFLEDEDLFALASAPGPVQLLLDALAQDSTMVGLPAVQSVAAALGNVGSAILSPPGCQPFDAARLGKTEEEAESLHAELRHSGISGRYTLFGLGYRMATVNGERMALGVLVHHYADAARAADDLEPRRHLAESGTSLVSHTRYAELFEVVAAEVTKVSDGSADLVLLLRARKHPPQLFFNMYAERDLLFSLCAGF